MVSQGQTLSKDTNINGVLHFQQGEQDPVGLAGRLKNGSHYHDLAGYGIDAGEELARRVSNQEKHGYG
jgi:hypothetical protein